MCRGSTEGGRRCPGCQSQAGRQAHNQRRRRNRELKTQILAIAYERFTHGELDQHVLARLQQASPSQAKQWAAHNGLPERFHPGKGHTPTAGAPAAGADWWTPELGQQINLALATQGAHPAEPALLEGHPIATARQEIGANTTIKTELDTGQYGFHKPFEGINTSLARHFGQEGAQQPLHEIAAWRLAAHLGDPYDRMVPTCVLREIEGKWGSFAAAVDGYHDQAAHSLTDADVDAAAFFDSVIGQQDRHSLNYLSDDQGHVHLIDHGYSFATPGDELNLSTFQTLRETPLTTNEQATLQRVLDSPDTCGLHGLLEEPRVTALRARVERMLSTGRVLPRGNY